MSAAVLMATFETAEGGPAALAQVDGSTLLARLAQQLTTLGAPPAWVVTRPGWGAQMHVAGAEVIESANVAEDLRQIAAIAGRSNEPLLIANADIVVHRESLAGLLANPKLATGILVTGSGQRAQGSFRVRAARGRVVAAASAYHRVDHAPTGYFLSVLKVDAADHAALAAAAAELAALLDTRPAEWNAELEAKAQAWGPDDAARVAAAAEDATALALVGLVRNGVHVGQSHLRGFFWARALSEPGARAAEEGLAATDEDRIALAAAVKSTDGFFTTYFVSPYSRYIARFAARRGWTPNAITTVSMAIGVASALAFATGSRAGMIAGAILLQAAFTFDCVDGQLARYTRQFSKLGAWLDSVFDRGKEYVVFAGLAAGASRGFDQDVWALAGAALTLQTARHMIDFSFAATRHAAIAAAPRLALRAVGDGPEPVLVDTDPEAERGGVATLAPPAAPPAAPARPTLARRALRIVTRLDRVPGVLWVKRIIVLPIGERFALISLTAALGTPRLTFTLLLAWGGLAALYAVPGRVLRSVVR